MYEKFEVQQHLVTVTILLITFLAYSSKIYYFLSSKFFFLLMLKFNYDMFSLKKLSKSFYLNIVRDQIKQDQ